MFSHKHNTCITIIIDSLDVTYKYNIKLANESFFKPEVIYITDLFNSYRLRVNKNVNILFCLFTSG